MYDGFKMFRGRQDQRIQKMLKLGKHNIKYLASDPQQATGCQGLLGPMSTLDYDLPTELMAAAKRRANVDKRDENKAVFDAFGL